MKKTIGHTTCPECGDMQTVMHDGRKYYIKCASCGVFISYQSNSAKARIESRLIPIAAGSSEPEPKTVQVAYSEPDMAQGVSKRKKPYKPAYESERSSFGS